jgi:hypothetical protein
MASLAMLGVAVPIAAEQVSKDQRARELAAD